MLKLNTAEVDTSVAEYVWSEDAEVVIAGVPLTPALRRAAAREAGVKGDGSGVTIVEATYDLAVETAHRCFREWRGLSTADGKPLPLTKKNIGFVVEQQASLVADAIRFFTELYEERSGAREQAEKN